MKLSVILLLVVLTVAAEAGKSCPKAVKKAQKKGQRVPQCDGKKFSPTQCDELEGTCFCVKTTSGKQLYRKFEFPIEEEYDCTRAPTRCEKKMFAALVDNEVPEVMCDANGDPIEVPVEPTPEPAPEPTPEPTNGSSCQVIENAALNKTAFQSSIGWNGEAGRAVDGNSATSYFSESCTHTLNDEGAWWAVDLGDSLLVDSVEITNRADCCADRLANFTIAVTNTTPSIATDATSEATNEVCATNSDALGAGEVRRMTCGKSGRYVVIQQSAAQYLTLCEVKVSAVPLSCDQSYDP